MARIKCLKCFATNIQLMSNDNNIKTIKNKTSLNINPLEPFTIFNHKTKVKKKTSSAKVGLGMMTGGMSLLFTGTKNNKSNEYFCLDCGYRWIGK